MSCRPTTTSAMTAAAALTLPEQVLDQAENQVSTDLAHSTTADLPANWRTKLVASDLASMLGTTTTNLRTQRTYRSNLSDSLTTGVGPLVDVGMNEAATKLATRQVQRQLGVQALSISNSDTRSIRKLCEL